MRRIDLWKAQLKAALAEMKIRQREANAATRTVARLTKTIIQLENKIDNYMAKS
jgi:polyhydroxyalkanoate synthesis regulator phasin